MYFPKVGPVAALVLSGVGLCLLILAPLGWRLGLWQYGFSLYWMMPVSGFVAAIAVHSTVSPATVSSGLKTSDGDIVATAGNRALRSAVAPPAIGWSSRKE